MKTRKLLFASLALNTVLLCALIWYAGRRSEAPLERAAGMSTASTTATKPKQSTTVIESVATNIVTVDWRMVESENYKQYIANLRGIGCPEETIRDIIVADVNKLFEARQKEMFPATNKFEYWKGGNFFASLFDEARMEKQKVLNAEKRALLKELLGVDVPDSADLISRAKVFETMLDFLPANKQTELMEFEQKFAAKMAKNMRAMQRGDSDAFRKMQAEKDAELLKILSPEEKFEYDLRMSQSAMVMRMQMGDVELSEQEFRDMFKLRKQFDDEHGLIGPGANQPQEREKRTAAQKELDGQTRQLLGDSRFLEYKYSGDFDRSSLKKITQEYNIPRTDSLKVFEIRDVAREQAAAVRANKSLSTQELQAQLDAIAAATRQEVGNAIGQPGLNAYLNEGSWLKNLNRVGGGGSEQ